MRKFICIILILITALSVLTVFASCTHDYSSGQFQQIPRTSARDLTDNGAGDLVCQGEFIDEQPPYGQIQCNYQVARYNGTVQYKGQPLYVVKASVIFVTGYMCRVNNNSGYRKYKVDSGMFSIFVDANGMQRVDMYPIHSYNEPLFGDEYFPEPQYDVSLHPSSVDTVTWIYNYQLASKLPCYMYVEYWFTLDDTQDFDGELTLRFDYRMKLKKGFLAKTVSGDKTFNHNI